LIGVVARVHLQPAIAPAPIPRRARAPVLVFAGRGVAARPDLNFSRQVSVHLKEIQGRRRRLEPDRRGDGTQPETKQRRSPAGPKTPCQSMRGWLPSPAWFSPSPS
jgi:hypothetical protein